MIYGLFNSDTGVWQCSIQKGRDFDKVGDESWKQVTASHRQHFDHSSDWLEISEQDYQKYQLGTSGGDNNAGYIRDMQTGECISAPPRTYSFDEQIANTQNKYMTQYKLLKDNLIEATLAGEEELVQAAKEDYKILIEASNAEFTQIINAAQ